MGSTESSAVINSLSESINEVSMSTVQSCEVISDQSQNLAVRNTGFKFSSDVTLEQTTDIRMECFSDINKQTELQNKIINEIAQTSTASNVALLGAFGSTQSEAIANLTNIVRNTITMSNIQRSYIMIKQQQGLTLDNEGVVVYEKVKLTQGAEVFAAATLKEIDRAGIFNRIANHVDQSAEAKTENPLDFIAKALGAVGDSVSTMLFLIIFIVAILVVGVYFVMKIMTN
jgi:hypothetical protein